MKTAGKICAALLLFSIIFASLLGGAGGEAGGSSLTAIYRANRLALTIPYHATHAGAGTLVVEILDPEDQVLGRVERRAELEAGGGIWKQEIKTTEPLPFDDLIWERIRYRFQYTGGQGSAFQEIHAISEILRRPTVHIIGQSTYLAGAPAAIRVIVCDSANHQISGASSIRVDLLLSDRQSRTLFEGRVNRRGTVETQFRFPAGLTGNYQLRFVADTPLGSAESTQPVRLENQASILLTAEKRMYQPGQTIHVRTLVLDRSNHHAVASGGLTFEIQDPRGNKVFKETAATDEYGIASAEFTLADEVNLGTYQLHALLGNPEKPTSTAELSFSVDRYVLPKFKVAVDFTATNGRPKREYRPGDHVAGTVQANYFFGKSVESGEITVKASSMDVSPVEAASASGRTDKDGTYHFDLRLPGYFAGRPQNNGAAPVLIEATVKDSSGHAETHGEGVTVSNSSLLVTAIPEGGTLIPGVENQIFLLASYPDGTPAVADMRVHGVGATDQIVTTDSRGVAVIRVTPGESGESLKIKADDRRGNTISTAIPLQPRSGMDQVLLRPDHAVYKAGDRMVLSVFSTSEHGTAYVDIVKDGQTVLTRDLDIANGRAQLVVNATPEMAGTLGINVYRLGEDAETVGDHRLVFVQPVGELRIQAVADAPVYKPGADARIQFHVANEHGEGVRAALGLQVVDEAVFALSQTPPGFAKAFFYLEQELLKPRYEIHAVSAPEIMEPTSESESKLRDRAAQALFSATTIINPNEINLAFGQEMPQETSSEYNERYRVAFEKHVADLAARFNKVSRKGTSLLESDGTRARDAWETELQIHSMRFSGYYEVVCAGADRQFDTPDDLRTFFDARTGVIAGRRARPSVEIAIHHQRGEVDGVAEISGVLQDPTGAAMPGATVKLGYFESTVTDAKGWFKFSGVLPGNYQIEMSAMGFQIASRRVTLQSRDVAVLTGKLMVGLVAQTVEVLPAFRRQGLGAAMEPLMAGAMLASPIAGWKEKAPPAAQPAPGQPAEDTHTRSYFPEALYINPEIITDRNGAASISIPMADSITNWRMTMLASTTSGALGTANSAIKVFQDFFVDLDLPVTLTQGDCVSIPVAIYNYSGQRGDVTLSLQNDDWFGLVEDSAEKRVTVEPGRVGSSNFTLEAKRIGRFKLKLSARMDGTRGAASQRQDIVLREIEVVPNGREQNIVFNGHLDSSVQHSVRFPAVAIPDSSKIFVRLYPGPLSQIMEGMDAILSLPGGCFEQTSSSTYPNVLALDYMKRTGKLTPEVHAKAEGYISNGYQRLLTFEVPGGGFSWFGNAPANKILTAYGLMEFHDMSKVHDVDAKLIQRTSDWLVAQQQGDGSWRPDAAFINEGAANRYNSDAVRITAYIAWSLENSGYRGPALERARQFIADHLNGRLDAYTLAVLANFAVDYPAVEGLRDNGFTRQSIEMLLDARTEKEEQVYWNSEETSVYSRGSSAAIETTGLAAQALLKWRQAPAVARKALSYIVSKKDASGTWGTTQATIMSLRALLMASEGTAEVSGAVQITLNGKIVEKLTLTPENSDLYQQFVLPGIRGQDANNLEIRFDGTGGLAYQVAGRYFVPWESNSKEEPLSIDVTYDRTKLAQNETVSATATVRNNLNETANMVMVDLGIPPGFELLTEDLESFHEKSAGFRTGSLEKFSLTATQAILYFNGFAPRSVVKLRFRLRAKYPIRAHNFQSRVYEYYDPSVDSIARPGEFEVTGK
jgi:uncharacterized protein YfaS (alpha-2-macroglobulin family)